MATITGKLIEALHVVETGSIHDPYDLISVAARIRLMDLLHSVLADVEFIELMSHRSAGQIALFERQHATEVLGDGLDKLEQLDRELC